MLKQEWQDFGNIRVRAMKWVKYEPTRYEVDLSDYSDSHGGAIMIMTRQELKELIKELTEAAIAAALP